MNPKTERSSTSNHALERVFRIDSKEATRNMCSNKSLLKEAHFEPKKMMDPQNMIFERFKSEATRLGTFDSNWPRDAPLDKMELARAGWFFTGQMDKVQCPWCKGAVYNWEKGDTAFGEHKKHFPSCPFVRELSKRELVSSHSGGACNVPEEPWYEMYSVRAVLDLGYDRKLVENAILNLERKKVKRKNINTDAILEELWKLDNGIDNEIINIKEQEPCDNDEKEANNACGYAQCDSVQDNHDFPQQDKIDNFPSSDSIPATIDHAFLQEQIAKLQDKTDSLKTNLTCKVCLEQTVGDLFLPCRHLVCCTSCSASVSRCPICRERIVGVIKVFI